MTSGRFADQSTSTASRTASGSGGMRRAGFGRHPFVEHQLRRDGGPQHVGRDLDIDRPRLAHIAHGPGDGLVQLADDLIGDARRPRLTRHRAQDVDMRDVLKRAHIGLRTRGAAADQQHRRAGERGVGHRRDGVGHARPGRDHGDAERAGQLAMSVRHMHGGALVADVDDADALACDMVPDRLDVPALKAEDAVDAALLQKARDPGGASGFVGVQVLDFG